MANVRLQKEQILGPGMSRGRHTTGLSSLPPLLLASHVQAYGLFENGYLIGWIAFDTPPPATTGREDQWSIPPYSFASTRDHDHAFLILGSLHGEDSLDVFVGICLRSTDRSKGKYKRLGFALISEHYLSTTFRGRAHIDPDIFLRVMRSKYSHDWLFSEANLINVTLE